ncbi:MAG: DUF937 domain-containing protein [Deltaproteobacteria bacterium]|nr:DUF937 domain-containing protein [Deltaproteobacteria bacterium]
MGLLDGITQAVSGVLGGSGAGQNPLVGAALQLLSRGGAGGGLSGLVAKMQGGGLAGIVNSWVGTGPNQPISADQVEQGLGSDAVQQLADKAGVTPEAAKTQLAGILPDLVDKLTPEGKLPDEGLLAQGLDLLRNKLGIG